MLGVWGSSVAAELSSEVSFCVVGGGGAFGWHSGFRVGACS